MLLTSEETRTQRDILEIIQKCAMAFHEKLAKYKKNTKEQIAVETSNGEELAGEENPNGEKSATEENENGEAPSTTTTENASTASGGHITTSDNLSFLESEIVSKKSVVFSLLEVCTFLVTRYAKDIVVSAGLVTGNVARKPGKYQLVRYSKLSYHI